MEFKRQEMIDYLISKKFTRNAAEKAVQNYIETKLFLAEEFKICKVKNGLV